MFENRQIDPQTSSNFVHPPKSIFTCTIKFKTTQSGNTDCDLTDNPDVWFCEWFIIATPRLIQDATFFRGVLALPMIEVTEQILRMTFALVVFSQFENSPFERKIIGAWLWISHSAKRLYDSSSQLGFFFFFFFFL